MPGDLRSGAQQIGAGKSDLPLQATSLSSITLTSSRSQSFWRWSWLRYGFSRASVWFIRAIPRSREEVHALSWEQELSRRFERQVQLAHPPVHTPEDRCRLEATMAALQSPELA